MSELMEFEGDVVRSTIRLPEGLHEAVAMSAKAAGLSFNAAVVAALIDFVSSDEHRQRVAEFFREGQARHEALLQKLDS